MNPSRPAAAAPGGYYAAYGTPAPGASAAQQQQYAAPHQQHQQHHQQPQQHAASAPGTAAAAGAPAAAYAAYAQAWQAQQQQQQNPPSAGHHQPQPQHYATQQPQQQRYAASAPAPGSAVGGYATAAPAAVAPAAPAYAHYAHPQQQQQTAAAVSYHQQYPQQQQQQYQQQPPPQQQQQPALTLPLLASSQQPLPAAPGQTLGAYAYPGGTGGGVAAAPAVTAAAGAGAGAGQQQQPALTPQQVAQEAIAKTMAAMQESQEQQLQPGQVLDNRRGYIHGNLIGQMEKARLERAAVKNENYVRRCPCPSKASALLYPLQVTATQIAYGCGAASSYHKAQSCVRRVECGADKHPVVVLRSVYTREESESDPDFFDDLEADMLMECVKFGTVISVSTPEAPGYFGCVVVTFENSGGANKCAEAMHGRWFDQRQIEALVAGKEVPDNEEKQNGPENFQQPQRQQEERGGVANGETKEEDMGPLLQGVPDSPPPTDLNSFLESV
ncbi:unnamed protein product [Scytosiphon promiscuus]